MYYTRIDCNSLGHPRFAVAKSEYNSLTKAQKKVLEARIKVQAGRKGTELDSCYILTTFLDPFQIYELIDNAK